MAPEQTSAVPTVNRPHKVLVGVDGSTTAQNALAWASGLALKHDGHVTAVSTWNYPAGALMPVAGYPILPSELMDEHATTRLDALVKSSPHPNVVTEQRVVMGSARMVLAELSTDQELLVVGRTGRRPLTQRLLGSTAAYCAHRSTCPVVVVKDAREPEREICVAVDGSEHSIDALIWALSLGDDHDVIAVYSHDEWELDELPLSGAQQAAIRGRADDIVADAVIAAATRCGVDVNRITTRVLRGDPRTTIVDRSNPQQMLVLGAQGHSGVAGWVLGSLADYAVTHAPGTVAIVR